MTILIFLNDVSVKLCYCDVMRGEGGSGVAEVGGGIERELEGGHQAATREQGEPGGLLLLLLMLPTLRLLIFSSWCCYC